MSIVSYGQGAGLVTLPYAITTFRQEALGDDKSNTDWYVTKFDITVQATINADYIFMLVPNLDPTATVGAADIEKIIWPRLMKRRQPLSIIFNGTELIPDSAGDIPGTVDAQNGPMPKSCVLTDMTNNTFLLTWNVVAHYWVNNLVNDFDGTTENQSGNPVLYNRWEESVDIDNRNRTTRTRDGKFVIRSDNKEGKLADELRTQMAVVGVPPGFLRDSSHYTIDPNGLAIAYRVVDKEAFRMPPNPAFEAEGWYRESCSRGGAVRYAECHLTLKGDYNTPQFELINTAISVVVSKLNLRLRQIDPSGSSAILEGASMRVDLYDNVVSFDAKVMVASDNLRTGQIIGAFAQYSTKVLGSPIAHGSTAQPNYLDRGTANLLLQAAAYYDPSLASTILGTGSPIGGVNVATNKGDKTQLNAGLVPGTAGATKES